jgi:heme A synthase
LIYLASALILGFIFLAYAIRIYKNPGDNQIAWRTFMFSVNYLMLLFVASHLKGNLAMIGSLLAIQIILGILNVVWSIPMAIATLHNTVALLF